MRIVCEGTVLKAHGIDDHMRIADDELHKTGLDTPAGRLLAQYWHPVLFSTELGASTTRQVRLLGRDLVVYRTPAGRLGVTDERCFHRGASLAYGLVEEAGLRCPYHGLLTPMGRSPRGCSENHPLKRFVRHPLSVCEVGGLIFVTMRAGDAGSPMAFEALVAPARRKVARYAVIPCNWFQIAENGLDPVHLEWLHGRFVNYVSERRGDPAPLDVRPHEEIQFEPCAHGILKRRRVVGQTRDEEDWTIGQIAYFPNIFSISSPSHVEVHYRTPINDEATLHIWYRAYGLGEGTDAETLEAVPAQIYKDDGGYDLSTLDGQDAMAWCTQGSIANRSEERLLPIDRGIAMFRDLFREQAAKCDAGGAPMGVGEQRVIHALKRTASRRIAELIPSAG